MTDMSKQTYGEPSLVSYGSITKLTQGGGSGGDGGGMGLINIMVMIMAGPIMLGVMVMI